MFKKNNKAPKYQVSQSAHKKLLGKVSKQQKEENVSRSSSITKGGSVLAAVAKRDELIFENAQDISI